MADSAAQRLRAEITALLSGCAWIILLTILLTAVLAAPEQIRELYRIVHADRDPAGFIRLYASVLAISAVLWGGALIVVRGSLDDLDEPLPATRRLARYLPILFGVAPLLGCAWAHWFSVPIGEPDTPYGVVPVGSPWERYETLIAAEGEGLRIAAGLLALLAVLVATPTLLISEQASSATRSWLARVFGAWPAFLVSVLLVAGFTAVSVRHPIETAGLLGVFGVLAVFSICIAIIVVHLSLLTLRHNLPYVPMLLSAAILFSLLDLNDNHLLEPVKPELSTDAVAKTAPTLGRKLLEEWYRSRPDRALYPESYPVYVVAAQGGGIYAAYQTAIFLARMQDLCPNFRHHLFAVSAVSGGSLGAAAFVTALQAEDDARTANGDATGFESETAQPCPRIAEFLDPRNAFQTDGLDAPGPVERRVRTMLNQNFLAPLIAASLFPDFTQRFLPFAVPEFDRARALEQSFVAAAQTAQGGGLNAMQRSFLSHWRGDGPALLINATDAASGRRMIFAPFAFKGARDPRRLQRSYEHYPFWGLRSEAGATDLSSSALSVGPEISLAAAAGVSARFPWVTPAASVETVHRETEEREKIRLVDGGYVDNSGVETALDLIEQMRPHLVLLGGEQNSAPLKINLIALTGGDYPQRSSFGLGEIMEPLRGLLSARQSRAYVALERAARLMPPDTLAIKQTAAGATLAVAAGGLQRVRLDNPFYELPLGWALSARSRDIVERQSGRFWECQPDIAFQQSAPGLSAADCVQMLVFHQLNNSLQDAAELIATVESAKQFKPPRTNHEGVVACFRNERLPDMNFAQRSAIVALLEVWDENPQWEDDRILAYLLGTVAHETASFRFAEENLNYSAERLAQVFRRFFPTVEDAQDVAGKPEEIANIVYGDRLGNTEPGDGWRYRGRGLIQVVGRYNYRQLGQAAGVDLEAEPDLLSNPSIAARVAFRYFFPDDKAGRIERFFDGERADWIGARRVVSGPRGAGAERVAELGKAFHRCIEKHPPLSWP